MDETEECGISFVLSSAAWVKSARSAVIRAGDRAAGQDRSYGRRHRCDGPGTVSVVVAEWVRLARRAASSRWLDYGIAAVLLVVTELELWRLPLLTPGVWGRLGGLVLGIAMTVPLAWRRQAPVLTLALVVGAQTGPPHLLFHPPGQGNGPLAPFLAMLLAAFSFGAYARLPRRATTVLLLLAGLSAAVLAQASDGHLDVGFWVAGVIFWVMGLLYRQRLLRVSELEGETTRLIRDRDAAARVAVAEERSRIARELHDVVAHSVSVMTVQAGAARHTLNAADTEMHEALQSIETAGRQALVELRRLLGILRQADDQPALAPVPSLADLDRLIAQLQDAGLPAVLHIEGESTPLPPGVDLAAYRIVQEALTNCLKHAGPTQAEVRIRYGRHELELEVLDDGGSSRVAGNGTGHGLIGMRERASLYGGFFEAGARPSGGFAVHARLPLDGHLR